MKPTTAASELLTLMGEVAQARVGAIPPMAAYGTIGPDLSLTVLRYTFQLGEYRIADYLAMGEPMTETLEAAEHTHGVVTPERLRPLGPGDRVAVLLLLGGTEPYVMGRVSPT